MNTYTLYGAKMIENDDTLKDFAFCILCIIISLCTMKNLQREDIK